MERRPGGGQVWAGDRGSRSCALPRPLISLGPAEPQAAGPAAAAEAAAGPSPVPGQAGAPVG